MKIESKVSEGTRVTVKLPIAQPPPWFTSVVSVEHGQTVVVVDDDESVLHVWNRRLSHFKNLGGVVFLQSENELTSYVSRLGHLSNLFLIDHELSKTGKTGLELITSLGIAKQSVLVTSRFADGRIQGECERLGIKMIPKALFPVVQIRVEPVRSLPARTVVLIEDSGSWRAVWSATAQKKGVNFQCFPTVEEFLDRAGEFRLADTEIYIDSDLGKDQLPGERAALRIFNLGFKHLMLTTGHSPVRFNGFWWIQGVVGKAPPF